jgi:hypothetical protein
VRVAHVDTQDVRDTLRTDLLDPYRRAREISQRALDLFNARLVCRAVNSVQKSAE